MLRSKIADEDQWIQHRVSWNLASSSFLAAAFVASAIATPVAGRALAPLRIALLYAIPLLGLLLSTAVLFGLIAATIAIHEAQRSWPAGDASEHNELRKSFPPLYSSGWAVWLGRVASWGTTLVLMKFWLLAFVFVGILAGGLRFAAH
jgi:hypothetical protein